MDKEDIKNIGQKVYKGCGCMSIGIVVSIIILCIIGSFIDDEEPEDVLSPCVQRQSWYRQNHRGAHRGPHLQGPGCIEEGTHRRDRPLRLGGQLRGTDRNFGNARYARNVFEKTIQQQANRLAGQTKLSRKQLTELTVEDLKTGFDSKTNVGQ